MSQSLLNLGILLLPGPGSVCVPAGGPQYCNEIDGAPHKGGGLRSSNRTFG